MRKCICGNWYKTFFQVSEKDFVRFFMCEECEKKIQEAQKMKKKVKRDNSGKMIIIR